MKDKKQLELGEFYKELRMARKVIISFIFVALAFFTMIACQNEIKPRSSAEKSYQLAIFATDKVATFNRTDDGIELKETFQREDSLIFWNEGFVETDNVFIAKTKEDRQFKSYVTTIDKRSLKEKTVPAQGNDVYTSVTDGKYYYATAVFSDRIEFYKYNVSLEVVHSKIIYNGETINASNQFVVIGDELYLLVSQVVAETGVPQTELWRMDKDFEIQERINLDESNPYLRMVAVGQTLYITEAFNGRTENGYLGGNKVLVYDLETGSKEYIQLTMTYPRAIYHDSVHNNLIIEHDSAYLSGIYWTIYNLESGTETPLSFPEIDLEDSFSSFFTMRNGRYYFLFDNNLIEVDNKGQKVLNIDLTQYAIDSPHAVIFKE